MGSGCGEEVEDEEVPLTGAVREGDRKKVFLYFVLTGALKNGKGWPFGQIGRPAPPLPVIWSKKIGKKLCLYCI